MSNSHLGWQTGHQTCWQCWSGRVAVYLRGGGGGGFEARAICLVDWLHVVCLSDRHKLVHVNPLTITFSNLYPETESTLYFIWCRGIVKYYWLHMFVTQ